MTGDDVSRALTGAMAAERLRIVAGLIRTTHDWDLAEDCVSDAAERAMRRWPADGIPDNPAAWLATTARRRAIDVLRRADVERDKVVEAAGLARLLDHPDETTVTSPLKDDRLRLVFTCCHPALPLEARVALTLKVVAGLSTATIARAFLTSEATMGQRLLRAKRKILHAGIPYRVPADNVLRERLDGVLAVVYLVFTEGYAAGAQGVGDEAIRLGRLLVELVPAADEASGLLGLMLLKHSRRDARDVGGERVTLEHQDRTLWDNHSIDEALMMLEPLRSPLGPYSLQARIAAVHSTAPCAEDTDWAAIVTLYDALLLVAPSPVVALNRSVAVGMSDGALAGLDQLDEVATDPRLAGHHLLAAVRGDLLARAGLPAEARAALVRAAHLAPTEPERRQLLLRADALRPDSAERGDDT